jgi:L,D-transpeptidase catalytic domain
MKQMMKTSLLLLVIVLIINGCAATPIQPPVAVALENQQQPFRTGVEIAKPTYTPNPAEIVPPTPLPPALNSTSASADTSAQNTFTENAFVVAENLAVPVSASSGYDNTTQYDSPPTYTGSKRILIDISEQHLYAYDGEQQVFSFIASTGMQNSTRIGNFSVLNKIPNAYGATWNIWMPNWLGIYWSGSLQNGIHALPILPNGATLWAGFLGTPVSYGCIVLDTYDAQALYNWADIGTPVEIRW